MTSVTIKKEIIEELIDFKLNSLVKEINRILSKWNYHVITDFLEHARNGTLEEAEDDAIDLTNLIDQRDELHKLKTNLTA